jgi:hypothetical protein
LRDKAFASFASSAPFYGGRLQSQLSLSESPIDR